MHNKGTAATIVIVSILLFVFVAIFVLREWKGGDFIESPIIGLQAPIEKKNMLSERLCDYRSDQEAYKDAVMSKDINQCECIGDKELKDVCKSASMDIMLYDRAMSYFDPALCEEIKDDVQKNGCTRAVNDLIAQYKKDNLQYLADMHAATHNEMAIGELEELIQRDPENNDNYVTLALVYAEKGLKEQERGRDRMLYVNKAFAVIAEVKQKGVFSGEIYRAEAYINEIKPDYDAALALYAEAIRIDPHNILAYAGRGHVHRIRGDVESAIADFHEAAQLDKRQENIFIYANLCNLEYVRENNEDAIKNCMIVAEKEDADPVFQSEAYQVIAMISIKKKDFAQARNMLVMAQMLTPNDSDLYVTFSHLAFAEGSYEDAESYAYTAIDFSPTKATACLAAAHALHKQEKFKESSNFAQKGLILVADDVTLFASSKSAVEDELNSLVKRNRELLGSQ